MCSDEHTRLNYYFAWLSWPTFKFHGFTGLRKGYPWIPWLSWCSMTCTTPERTGFCLLHLPFNTNIWHVVWWHDSVVEVFIIFAPSWSAMPHVFLYDTSYLLIFLQELGVIGCSVGGIRSFCRKWSLWSEPPVGTMTTEKKLTDISREYYFQIKLFLTSIRVHIG